MSEIKRKIDIKKLNFYFSKKGFEILKTYTKNKYVDFILLIDNKYKLRFITTTPELYLVKDENVIYLKENKEEDIPNNFAIISVIKLTIDNIQYSFNKKEEVKKNKFDILEKEVDKLCNKKKSTKIKKGNTSFEFEDADILDLDESFLDINPQIKDFYNINGIIIPFIPFKKIKKMDTDFLLNEYTKIEKYNDNIRNKNMNSILDYIYSIKDKVEEGYLNFKKEEKDLLLQRRKAIEMIKKMYDTNKVDNDILNNIYTLINEIDNKIINIRDIYDSSLKEYL